MIRLEADLHDVCKNRWSSPGVVEFQMIYLVLKGEAGLWIQRPLMSGELT